MQNLAGGSIKLQLGLASETEAAILTLNWLSLKPDLHPTPWMQLAVAVPFVVVPHGYTAQLLNWAFFSLT